MCLVPNKYVSVSKDRLSVTYTGSVSSAFLLPFINFCSSGEQDFEPLLGNNTVLFGDPITVRANLSFPNNRESDSIPGFWLHTLLVFSYLIHFSSCTDGDGKFLMTSSLWKVMLKDTPPPPLFMTNSFAMFV